jgi:hypothetical protein
MNLRFCFNIVSVLFLLLILFQSCKKDKSRIEGFKERDLITEGIPLKIQAPEDAEVNIKVENFYKDISIKKGKDYSVQITGTEALTNVIDDVRKELENEVKKNPYFSEIIIDEPNGFVFEKKTTDGSMIYDFRYIKIEGNQQFVFQTGIYSEFNKDEVMKMYNSVKP